MNKWIKVYMEEHDLKPNERFEIVQEKDNCKYFFREDGELCKDVGTHYECVSFHTLGGLMDGIKIEKVKQLKYIPKLGGYFWFVSSYGVIFKDQYVNENDKYVIEHNLVFRTEEEAEDYRWFLEQVDKYKKESVYGEHNHCIDFYHDLKELIFSYYTSIRSQGTTYFGSKENIEEFRNIVGDERIKKYMFNIWGV